MAGSQNPTRTRRSIRRYRPDAVPEPLIREVLEEGRWAPSATNTQSTAVYVLTGATLDRVRAGMREAVIVGATTAYDLETAPPQSEPYASRTKRLFDTRGAFVAAEEGEPGPSPYPGVPAATVAMAEFFGAPALLVFAFDKGISTAGACFDAGLFVQNVALAAHMRGLGACIMTSPLRFAAVLHAALPGSEGQALVAVMALGYPDPAAAVNRFPRERVAVGEFVTFVG